MTEQIMGLVANPVKAVRRNHALEHATLHILGRKYKDRGLGGYSDQRGFWIVGDLETDAVQAAVDEALIRLKTGERHLAVHPNCGTNFVVAGVSAGLAAALAMAGAGRRSRDKLGRVPLAVSLATIALISAQPIGNAFQERITTSGDPGAMQVVGIEPKKGARLTAHRIITKG